MHDRAPRNEISPGLLSIQADALFAFAQFTESSSVGEPGLIHTSPTETGQLESMHLVVPVSEEQVDITVMGDDGMTATDTRIVRRLESVVLQRTTADSGVSYRIIADPAHREKGAWENERAQWSDADQVVQKKEYGYAMAGRTEKVRPLRADELMDVWNALTSGTPYNPAEQTLLQSSRGDKLIKNNVFAGLRTLLGKVGMAVSRWAEDNPQI